MQSLPFSALVGLELAQQALLLLAVEPRLRGVVLAAGAGTGKSSLARGLKELLHEDTPFVELPPSVDVENLLGGLDLEATLRTGELRLQHGVLARANEGIVYVDGINLLTDATTNLLLSVMDSGEVVIEREGVSERLPADIRLIGSYDPAEGLPRQHLIDRVGLIVPLMAAQPEAQRQRVIERNLYPEPEQWLDDTAFLRGLILAAQEALPHVTITDAQIDQLAQIALAYGVEGHRADLFAVQAACASAATELRESVDAQDIETAVRLVIFPRATQIPEQQPDQPAPPQQREPGEEQTPESEPPPPQDHHEDDDPTEATALPEELLPPPDEILEAITSELPDALDDLPFYNIRRGQAGSRGATEGKRGRHIRSVPGNPKRDRIDVVATLRAASPWQPLRSLVADRADKRVHLVMSDIRVKKYRSKAGALFCFAVDASGSMALHRMRQAKGAVHTLLEKAYVERDRVALIAFRGQAAELLMPPTQSVELARRALDLLPTGGGTPLASAILLAGDVAQQARMRGIMQTVLILLTDGRGNIPLHEGENPQDELRQLGAYVQDVGLQVIVVDTKRSYLSKGEARQLAAWLGGDYAYLPNASGEAIGEFVAELR